MEGTNAATRQPVAPSLRRRERYVWTMITAADGRGPRPSKRQRRSTEASKSRAARGGNAKTSAQTFRTIAPRSAQQSAERKRHTQARGEALVAPPPAISPASWNRPRHEASKVDVRECHCDTAGRARWVTFLGDLLCATFGGAVGGWAVRSVRMSLAATVRTGGRIDMDASGWRSDIVDLHRLVPGGILGDEYTDAEAEHLLRHGGSPPTAGMCWSAHRPLGTDAAHRIYDCLFDRDGRARADVVFDVQPHPHVGVLPWVATLLARSQRATLEEALEVWSAHRPGASS